jgi:D-glycero-D-manno-heptose 1,7-bisphosphate phosphatase
MTGAVFLDRDGVLNAAVVRGGRPYPPSDPAEVKILPGVSAAIDTFREAGLMTVVVTNQPDIARGTASIAAIEAINAFIAEATGVDLVVTCAHDDADGCSCRKPLPGMITTTAEQQQIDLARSVMVGDRWRDIEAGRAAGIATVYVDHGYHERAPEHPDLVVADLPEAVPWILKTTGGGSQ